MQRTLVTVAALILTGCSDIVTTRFATLDEAKAQRAFDRGWLPPIMPASARSIVEKNDLDLNTGTGSFEYDLSERACYLERLRESGVASREEQATDTLILITNGSRWEIALQRTTGQARYRTRLLR